MSTLLINEINDLKRQKSALILAHFYQESQIQDVADFIGDSLALAQNGQRSNADLIVMAGVRFMAESVKILSPGKRVLLPDLEAGCSLVDQSPITQFKAWREARPEALCVTYINSSIEVKALSDIICTSSNAERIIRSIPLGREILFAPDKQLGRYLSKKTGREMTLWPGSCQVHVLFSIRKLFELKSANPSAIVLAHPECPDGILEQADIIGSTNLLLEESRRVQGATYIVATEAGILHQMQKSNPVAKFIQAPAEGSCACNECPFMRLNTLEKLRDALKFESPEIKIDERLIAQAKKPLQRMMELSASSSFAPLGAPG